jgi:YD repeat-containing protein
MKLLILNFFTSPILGFTQGYIESIFRMKIWNLLIILIVLFGCSDNKQKKKTDLEKMNLNENVNFLKESIYVAVLMDGKIVNEAEKSSTFYEGYIFDVNGVLIEELKYNSDAEKEWSIKFKYDKRGVLINKLKQNLLDEGLLAEYKFVFDDIGNLVKEYIYWSGNDKGDMLNEYKYDDKGNIIEKIEYNEHYYLSDDTTSKTIYKFEYDSLGNVIIENSYWGDWKHKLLRTYKYEAGKKVFEQSKYVKITYEYDEHGNEIRRAEDYGSGRVLMILTSYEFDEHNNWIKKTVNSAGAHKDNLYLREIDYHK